MRILELEVEGYRSLKHVTWQPGDLNVVIGPNCAGKSNLLRLIEMLSISAQGKLGKHIQASGGMEPLVWDGQADGIQCRVKTSPVESWRDVKRYSLTYVLNLGRIGQSSAFRVDYELLGNYYRVQTGEKSDPLKFLERRGLQARIFDEHEQAFVVPEEEVVEEEAFLAVAGGPFSYNKVIPPYQKRSASWCVYHDLHVNREAPIRSPAVTRTETSVSPDGQNLVSVLHTLYTGNRDFKSEIDAAMRAAFGSDFDGLVFPPAADNRIQLGVGWKSLRRTHSAADLSDGTLRFLLLLTILASPAPPPVIAIDEPETGLHPSMLPIVAEFAVEASERSQIVLTTHSPQLLDAFRDTVPTTTVATWEAGETHLKVLQNEALEEWVRAYSLGKLFAAGDLEGMA